MTSDQSLEIKLESSPDIPLELDNVLIEIHFFVNGNYRYGFKAGRTDKSGKLHLSYIDIEHQRISSAEQFLMDYNTRFEDCDARIEILVPTQEALEKAVENVKTGYGRAPSWAADWPSNDQIDSQPQISVLREGTTQIVIPCRPAGQVAHPPVRMSPSKGS